MSINDSNQNMSQEPRFLTDDFDPKLNHVSVSFLRKNVSTEVSHDSFRSSFTRNNTPKVANVSFVDVPESGIVFLLGKNGSGKSRFIEGLNALSRSELCDFPSVSLIFEIPNMETQLSYIESLEKIKKEEWLKEFVKRSEFFELRLTDVLLDSFQACSRTSEFSFIWTTPWPEKNEDLLVDIGADEHDLNEWKTRKNLYDQRSDYSHPAWHEVQDLVRENYVLSEHFLDFIVASMSQSYVSLGNLSESHSMVNGSEWWVDKSKRTVLFNALKELIEQATHISIKFDRSPIGDNLQFELLARNSQSNGRIADLLSERKVAEPVKWVNMSDSADRGTYRPNHQDSFPFDMIQEVDFLGEKYFKSISIPIAKSILKMKRNHSSYPWSFIGLTVLDLFGERENVTKQLQSRVWGLTQTERIKDQRPETVAGTSEQVIIDADDKNSFVLRVTGVDRINFFYKEVSELISVCDIGISNLKAMEPDLRAVSAPAQYELAPPILFQDAETQEWLPITKASQGQFDVILFLCGLHLFGLERSSVRFMVADEFDKHLHPTAATKVLEITQKFCLENKITAFISTHSLSQYISPEIRGLPRIFFDRNVTGDICLTSRSSADPLLVAEVLGATELDAYLLKNLYVMVEGKHEILIFNDLLKSEGKILEDIRMFSSAGTYGFVGTWETLRLLHSPVLITYDKKSEELELAWKQIQEAAADFQNRLNLWNDFNVKKIYYEVEKRKNHHSKISGDTELWSLVQFLKLILSSEDCRRQVSRVFLHGIKYEDIVDALPIKHFVGSRFKSWDDARMQHRLNPEKFKKTMNIHESSIKDSLAKIEKHYDPELLRVKEVVNELLKKRF